METFKESIPSFLFYKYMSNIKNESFGSSKEYIRGVVYLYINKINGKVYIGQTIQEEIRKNQHKNTKDNSPFHIAISKHGWENFKYKILFQTSRKLLDYEKDKCAIKNLLSIEEAYFIKKYKSNNPKYGYNICPGGAPPLGTHSKSILLFTLTGELINRFKSIKEASFITGVSESTIDSKINKRDNIPYIDCDNNVWIKEEDFIKIDKDFLFPMEEVSLGNSKKVSMFTLDGKLETNFINITTAAEYIFNNELKNRTKVSNIKRKISHTCSGIPLYGKILVSCFSHRWAFTDDVMIGNFDLHLDKKEDILVTDDINNVERGEKIIQQYSLRGELLNEFFTSVEAAKTIFPELNPYNISSSILKCCKNKQETAYNYKWKYKNDRK